MTTRDFLENHADVLYHVIAAVLGCVTVGLGLVALGRYLVTGQLDNSIVADCAGLGGTATTFMGGAVANARWNPNNS